MIALEDFGQRIATGMIHGTNQYGLTYLLDSCQSCFLAHLPAESSSNHTAEYAAKLPAIAKAWHRLQTKKSHSWPDSEVVR
jgi:hypothetical protein